MSKLIVGNWKMNPPTFSAAEKIARSASAAIRKTGNKAKVVLCPPFIWLASLSGRKYFGLEFGAQDVFWESDGPYTGEVSAAMLKNSGVKYVIVGHSERRRLGETDEIIAKKVKAVIRAGLKPILCVGEDKATRLRGIAAAKKFVKSQLQKDLFGRYSEFCILNSNLVIAYEPLWAISTEKNSRVDTPEDAADMIQFIKDFIETKKCNTKLEVIYGGSVTAANVLHFLVRPEIDGILAGGVSIKRSEFKKIIKLINNAK